MNASKDIVGSGGCYGAGNGLRGGKTGQVARRHRGIESQEPDPSIGARDKPTVWSHGKYVMVRPPKGPGFALRRARVGGHTRVYGGDPMTNLVGSSNTTTSFQDGSNVILNGDDDDDFSEDFDDRDNSDDGGDDGDDGGDNDVRGLIKRQGKRIMTNSSAGGSRGRGSRRGNRHSSIDNVGEMARSSARRGSGRGGG